MINVSFLNKNLYRKYPLKATSSYVSIENNTLPLAFLSGGKFTTVVNRTELYIRKIVVNQNSVSVSIAVDLGGGNFETFGYINSLITTDFQTVNIIPVAKYAGGIIVFGLKNVINSYQGTNTFNNLTGAIESSLIVPRILPAVTSIYHNTQALTGNINLSYSNILGGIVGTDELTLAVEKPILLTAPGDKNLARGNCGYNPIGKINTVSPDINGNIDVFGIDPVQISVTAVGIQLTVPNVSITDICTNNTNNIPPVPFDTPNTYPLFLTATQEEWKEWPQYVI